MLRKGKKTVFVALVGLLVLSMFVAASRAPPPPDPITEIYTYLTGTIKPELDDISGKLGIRLTGPYTVMAKLEDIKTYLTGTIYPAVDEVESLLENSGYGLSAIKTYLTGTINHKLDDLLLDRLTIDRAMHLDRAAQAYSDGYKCQFYWGGPSSYCIYWVGERVGTVTVTIRTSGVGSSETLYIRYYLDPSDPSNVAVKVVTSGENTLGWTDTAAAWRVELFYTFSSGVDTVYYAYSVIYPPKD